MDVCNFITSHSVVKIVTRDERNVTHLVELTNETYYHMSFNVTFAVNCEIKRFRPFIVFMTQLLSILEKTEKFAAHKIEIIKRSGKRVPFNSNKVYLAIKGGFSDFDDRYTSVDVNLIYDEVI